MRDQLRRVARHLPPSTRQFAARALPESIRGAPPPAVASDWSVGAPFPAVIDERRPTAPAWCVICRWQGEAFEGPAHCEAAKCPRCGSIARDRFLLWCFLRRGRPAPGMRVLETSPRLDDRYRRAMGRWFDYQCSDYDERAHRGVIRLDLQDMDLPDRSVDVLLTPHVVEHVPDTDRVLSEVRRVLAPGGRMYLQVPVLQGRTAPPTEPEFHGDDTPVFWRFGFDLTARLRNSGFSTVALVTHEWRALVASGARSWPDGEVSPEFDVTSMLEGAVLDDLHAVATPDQARQIGAVPSYMFLTWECIKPDHD
jgi:SAM-dependent methyltransferase